MIIHPVRQTQLGEETLFSARVEFESGRPRPASDLWFRFYSQENIAPSSDLDPFCVSLLLVAMQRREPLIIRGSLSRRLFVGLKEYQKIYHSWYPDLFHIIDVEPLSLRDDLPEAGARGTACAFSGGVDSFYTFLNLRENSNLTDAVFMAGFDMPLNLTASISELTCSYSEMMQKLGIRFTVGSTNIRSFVNTVNWTNAHGQALIATALFFKSSWCKFYIPSSYTSGTYPKWGTHPELDSLLSTETMEILHHGDQANRVKKLAKIAEFPESYDRLRVCWIQDIGLKNCGECEKCIRTQIALSLLGKLESYTTFRKELSPAKIRSLTQRTKQGRLFSRELMKEALRRGKLGVWRDLAYSLLRRELRFRARNFGSTIN